MRNLITAVFLTLIVCAFPASSKDLAKGSNQSLSVKTGQLNYKNSFRDSLWEERFNEWVKRHKAVSQRKPRVTFRRHKQSSSKSFRSSHRSFKSSHRPKTKHARRGRTHVRRRSRR